MKMTIPPDTIYRFNAVLVKIPTMFFMGIEKNPKVLMEPKKILNRQSNMDQKSNAGGIAIPDLREYYRTLIVKSAWYEHVETCKSEE